jgi:hypothetical protein
MAKMKHRFVRVTDYIDIPVPLECTPEEEQALVAKFKAENDLAELDAEARQLERDIAENNLVPIEDVLRDLGIAAKEPA